MEKVSVDKDEYVDLLRCKVRLLQMEAASAPEARRFDTSRHMGRDEKLETARLHEAGYSSREISEKTGRSYSTVRRFIWRLNKRARAALEKADYTADTPEGVCALLDRIRDDPPGAG